MFGVFGKNKEIEEILNTQLSDEHYKMLDKWKAIYAGYLSEWHDVRDMTVNGVKKRRRHSINMAKISSNELSKLIFTEHVEFNISDKAHHENINNLLKANRFGKVFQDKIEQMLALGGMALKVNPKELPDGTYKLLIAYVTPDCIIPISWENGEVTEAAFLNITKKKDKTYCLFEIHKWKVAKVVSKDGKESVKKLYTIANTLYERDTNASTDAKEVPLSTLYPELQEYAIIENLTQPLFQYLKPNIANNMDLQSPLGISIFANALDTLYALDVAFDSFIREFKLGKRRIIVPSQAVRTVLDPLTGEMNRYFDADDEVYQAMNFSEPEKQKITDNTVDLRVDEHVSAINALLNLYAMQTGFSTGTFSFDGEVVKTATEIISENSKTYQTIRSNENVIEEGLEKFIRTLSEVAALYEVFDLPSKEFEIDFNWDDSIVGDKYTDSDFYIKLNQNGLVSKKYSLMKILGLTEEQADEMLKEVKEETASETPDIDDVLADDSPLGKIPPKKKVKPDEESGE